jgi:hypothetical protein
MGAGWGIIFELDSGAIERLRVTPVSRFALLMGTVLLFVVPALILIAVAIPFGYYPHAGGVAILLALLCLLTATVSAWSSALGLTLREIGSLAAVVTGLQLPLTLLSGILLPLSLAPAWLRRPRPRRPPLIHRRGGPAALHRHDRQLDGRQRVPRHRHPHLAHPHLGHAHLPESGRLSTAILVTYEGWSLLARCRWEKSPDGRDWETPLRTHLQRA